MSDINSPEGFAAVYREYVKKLCRIAYNQVADESIAQGIVQNVFCSLWERRKILQIQGNIENYLVRAVKLAVLDHIRIKANRRRHLDYLASARSDLVYDTEDQINVNELRSLLNRMVNQLPDQCKTVYRLRREHGLTVKEIAGELQIAEKTVEAHLSKALKFLKLKLGSY